MLYDDSSRNKMIKVFKSKCKTIINTNRHKTEYCYCLISAAVMIQHSYMSVGAARAPIHGCILSEKLSGPMMKKLCDIQSLTALSRTAVYCLHNSDKTIATSGNSKVQASMDLLNLKAG